jgi:hypothetical protein
MAARQGLILTKSRRRDPAHQSPRYMLFDDPNSAIAVLVSDADRRDPLDISGVGFEGSLDEVESFLRRGEHAG